MLSYEEYQKLIGWVKEEGKHRDVKIETSTYDEFEQVVFLYDYER